MPKVVLSNGASGSDKKQYREAPMRRYPWAVWFSKDAFTLTRGKDYNGHGHVFAGQIRNACVRYKIKVSIDVLEDGDKVKVKVTQRRK